MGSRFRRGAGIAAISGLAVPMCFGAAPAHAALPSPVASAYVVASDAFGIIPAVAPTPVSTYPPGGTSSQAGIGPGRFFSTSTLTAITAGDPVAGTSSASATVNSLFASLGVALGGISLTNVNASCDAGPHGATGSAVISAGRYTPALGPAVPLLADAPANTGVTIPGVGRLTLNEQSTDADGVLTVNAVHLTLLPLLGGANVVVGHAQCGGAAPGPTITKRADESSFVVGQNIHYHYTVRNNGTEPLTDIAVTDSGPGSPLVSCPAGPLAPGNSEDCTATYTATAADATAGSITDTATLTATIGSEAPRAIASSGGAKAAKAAKPAKASKASKASKAAAAPEAAEAPMESEQVSVTSNRVTVPLRALGLTKSAVEQDFQASGQRLHYTYTVTNTGQAPLTGVAVSDSLAGVTVSGCGTDHLAPGESTTCQATYTTTAADVGTTTVTDQGTATAVDSTGQRVGATSNQVITPLSALTVLKSTTQPEFTGAGQTINYTYHVTNTGAQSLSGIGVVDSGPGTPTVTCPSDTLAAGNSEDCTASYVTTDADVAAGKIVDQATVSAQAPGGDTVSAQSDPVTVPFAGLTIVKAVQETTFSAEGQLLHYTFVVRNNGSLPLTSIAVSDPAVGSPSVSCPVSVLAPGASTTCTATYTTTHENVEAGRISDTATVSGATADGTVVGATSNTVTVVACTPCQDEAHGGCPGDDGHHHHPGAPGDQDAGRPGDLSDRDGHHHHPGAPGDQDAGRPGDLSDRDGHHHHPGTPGDQDPGRPGEDHGDHGDHGDHEVSLSAVPEHFGHDMGLSAGQEHFGHGGGALAHTGTPAKAAGLGATALLGLGALVLRLGALRRRTATADASNRKQAG